MNASYPRLRGGPGLQEGTAGLQGLLAPCGTESRFQEATGAAYVRSNAIGFLPVEAV